MISGIGTHVIIAAGFINTPDTSIAGMLNDGNKAISQFVVTANDKPFSLAVLRDLLPQFAKLHVINWAR